MSTATREILALRGEKAACTVWPSGIEDDYGSPTYGAPYKIYAEYKAPKGYQISAEGKTVTVNQEFYTEFTDATSGIKPDDFITFGDKTDIQNPTEAGAVKVLLVSRLSAVLPDDNDDMKVMC